MVGTPNKAVARSAVVCQSLARRCQVAIVMLAFSAALIAFCAIFSHRLARDIPRKNPAAKPEIIRPNTAITRTNIILSFPGIRRRGHARPGRALTSGVGAMRLISGMDAGFRHVIAVPVFSAISGSAVPTPRRMPSRIASAFLHRVALQRSSGTGIDCAGSREAMLRCQRGRPPA